MTLKLDLRAIPYSSLTSQLNIGASHNYSSKIGMLDLESKFEMLEGEVKEINANKVTLKNNLLDLIELQHILQGFFHEVKLVNN